MPKGVYVRNPTSKIFGRDLKLTPKQDLQISKLYKKGLNQRELADKFGVRTVYIRLSLKRTKTLIDPKRKGSPGIKNPSWKGGRTIDANGYVLIYNPNHPFANSGGYVREHRLVIEKVLGRFLEKKEVVHHKNGDKQDNRIENLLLFSNNGIHLGVELMGKIPKWTLEGLQRIASRKVPSMKGILRSPIGSGVRQSRKKLIQKFLHKTSQLRDTGLVAELQQLPSFRPRVKKKKREKV